MDEINQHNQIVNPTPNLPEEPKKKVTKKMLFLTIVIVGLVVMVLVLFLFFNKTLSVSKTISKSLPVFKEESISLDKNMKQWPNCSDIRGVVEEKNKLYVACLGGLLILDEKTGVLSQLTTTDGINSSTLTSLIKDGDKLYVGSQKGVNIFDLKNKTYQKFTKENGLMSENNITLALDGDYLWIGSFKGLNRYNLKTKQMDSFSSELADNSIYYSVNELLVTPKAVYVIDIASSGTPGGVARYDKATNTWERFGPQAFPKNTAETYYDRSRIDLYTLALVGDYVLVQDNGRGIWQAVDKQGSSWESVDVAADLLKNSTDYMYLFSGKNDRAYFVYKTEKVSAIYSYDPATKAFGQFLSNDYLKNINSNLFQKYISNGKMWFGSDSDIWLSSLEIDTLKTKDLRMDDRPKSVERLLGVINNKAIISSNKDLWQYNGKNFSKLFNFSDESLGGIKMFQPIFNTSKIIILSQFCGQGCSDAKLMVYDYKTKEKINLNINKKNQVNYEDVNLRKYDVSAGKIIFDIGYESIRQTAIVDLKDFSVKFETTNIKRADENNRITCNFSYAYVQDKFKEISCPEKAENGNYVWTIGGGYNSSVLVQEDKKTNKTTVLGVDDPVEMQNPDVYTQQRSDFNIDTVRFFDGKLWLTTNKGLMIYDPERKTWKLIDTKDGLLSNQVSQFVVDGNNIWANSDLGGISFFPIPN